MGEFERRIREMQELINNKVSEYCRDNDIKVVYSSSRATTLTLLKIVEEAKKECPINIQNERWYAERHPKSQRARRLKWFLKWFGHV